MGRTHATQVLAFCRCVERERRSPAPTVPTCRPGSRSITRSSAPQQTEVRTIDGGPSGTNWVISTLVYPDDPLDWYNGFDYVVLHTLVTVFCSPRGSRPRGES